MFPSLIGSQRLFVQLVYAFTLPCMHAAKRSEHSSAVPANIVASKKDSPRQKEKCVEDKGVEEKVVLAKHRF
eukprot:1369566-Prymnesium_polylepis.1